MQGGNVKMESSSYKVVLTSDATRGSTRYLQHYGVKGMKWGVVHDEDEKRINQSSSVQSRMSPNMLMSRYQPNAVGPIKPRLEYMREHRQTPSQTTFKQEAKNAAKELSSFMSDENNREMMKEGLVTVIDMAAQPEVQASIKEGLGAAFNVATTPEARAMYVEAYNAAEEMIDTIKDVELRELEERNPVMGKTLRAVDNFLESVGSFVADFTKSVNKIVGDIMSWGKKLFGG